MGGSKFHKLKNLYQTNLNISSKFQFIGGPSGKEEVKDLDAEEADEDAEEESDDDDNLLTFE